MHSETWSCFIVCSFSDLSDISDGALQVRRVSHWDKYTSFSWRITSPPHLVWGHWKNEGLLYVCVLFLSKALPRYATNRSSDLESQVIKLLKHRRLLSLLTNHWALCPRCRFHHNEEGPGNKPDPKPGKRPWVLSWTLFLYGLKRLQMKLFKFPQECFFLPTISIENRSLTLCTVWGEL